MSVYFKLGMAITNLLAKSLVVRVICSSRKFIPAEMLPPMMLMGLIGKPPSRTTAVCLPRQITVPVLTRVMRMFAATLTSEYTPKKRACLSVISPLTSVSHAVAALTFFRFTASVAADLKIVSMRCIGTNFIPVGARLACKALRKS